MTQVIPYALAALVVVVVIVIAIRGIDRAGSTMRNRHHRYP